MKFKKKYCTHCFKSRENVLKKVTSPDDKGISPFGIAFVDPF